MTLQQIARALGGEVCNNAVHRSLPIPSDGIVRWLIDQGVSDDAITLPWPLRESAVRFERGGVFDFDAEGDRAIIFRAEDRGECSDLIAWSARTGKIASWHGNAFCLGGVAEIWNPAHYLFNDALPVHRSPLQWLQAERTGIVIIEPRDAYGYLRSCPRVRVSDHVFGRQLERWIQPPKPTCQIMVEMPERQAAA
jgi:hypothetical protein